MGNPIFQSKQNMISYEVNSPELQMKTKFQKKKMAQYNHLLELPIKIIIKLC